MEKPTLKSEAVCLAMIAIMAFAIFANSLAGEFVYDDQRQVVTNPLIQDPKLVAKALTSDVWAFKGDGSVSASNYWRPTFTAWSMLNFRLFGLEPLGWHFLNVLLHACVCLLGFWFLRRLEVPRLAALAIATVFAVHPVHTESVAWIAGSPDLLFGSLILTSLIFADRAFSADRNATILNILVAVIAYALALGSKEVALLCLPLYWLLWAHRRQDDRLTSEPLAAVKELFPFIVSGVAFFVGRLAVIGSLSRPAEDAASFGTAILSIPAAIVFYFKQAFFPVLLGPNYPLRPVSELTASSFFIPLVFSIAVIAWMVFVWRHGNLGRFAVALFVLPLIPALNISAFIPEQIVHDRYLYLPLLGLLLSLYITVRAVEAGFGKDLPWAFAVVCFVAAMPLAFFSFAYNRVWASDFRLWQYAVKIDPDSAFNWNQLGAKLSEEKRYSDAVDAYDRSLAVKRTPGAIMGRARDLMDLRRFPEAIAELKAAAQTPPSQINLYTLYQIYETLGVAQQSAGDGAGAEATLREGRSKMPIYAAALTEKLAVVLYMESRKQDALNELESMRANADRELLVDSKVVFLRLGMLYLDAGKAAEARRDLQHFLDTTANSNVPEIVNDRAQAVAALGKVR